MFIFYKKTKIIKYCVSSGKGHCSSSSLAHECTMPKQRQPLSSRWGRSGRSPIRARNCCRARCQASVEREREREDLPMPPSFSIRIWFEAGRASTAVRRGELCSVRTVDSTDELTRTTENWCFGHRRWTFGAGRWASRQWINSRVMQGKKEAAVEMVN